MASAAPLAWEWPSQAAAAEQGIVIVLFVILSELVGVAGAAWSARANRSRRRAGCGGAQPDDDVDRRMRPTPYDNATQWRIAPWQPPAWVFGPVWTALYACIGLAGAVLYLQHGEGWAAASDTYWQLAIAFWFVQLLFNGLWTPAYFYWYEPRGALALLVLALGAALTSTVCMFLVGRAAVAGALMLPYLVWLLYALTLNAYVVAANDMDALVRRREAYWSPAPAEKKRQMMMLRL